MQTRNEAVKQEILAERANLVLSCLSSLYPLAGTVLEYTSAWELLVATVLAAQCTDARVNTVTPEFFRLWPGPAELCLASQEEVEKIIHPTGFFRNKAKNLRACAMMVQEHYDGKLPESLNELVKLPGVARKTANVILFGAFGINEGIAVDTHVRRISYRLGFTLSQVPERIEQDLMKLFPQEEWGNLNQRMVLFGRDLCMARKARCNDCPLERVCPKKEPPKNAISKGGKETT